MCDLPTGQCLSGKSGHRVWDGTHWQGQCPCTSVRLARETMGRCRPRLAGVAMRQQRWDGTRCLMGKRSRICFPVPGRRGLQRPIKTSVGRTGSRGAAPGWDGTRCLMGKTRDICFPAHHLMRDPAPHQNQRQPHRVQGHCPWLGVQDGERVWLVVDCVPLDEQLGHFAHVAVHVVQQDFV
jgi:hypothetical protein